MVMGPQSKAEVIMINFANFFKEHKKAIVAILSIVAIVIALISTYLYGYRSGYQSGYNIGRVKTKANTGDKNIVLPGDVKTETQTVVKYVPKTSMPGGQTEKTDVEANLGKQQITVKVNGHEQVIQKADSEKYAFEKNKLQLDQTSKATVEIKVPVVDKTRRWSVGIGYGRNGIAGKVDYPIGHVVGGWVAGDKKTVIAGVSINF